MKRTFCNSQRLFVQLSLLLVGTAALAADVNCVDYTMGPAECCTLATDSAEAARNTRGTSRGVLATSSRS